MFRDDAQTCRALRVLLGTLHMEHLWADDGPTDRAVALHEAGGGPLSSGEKILLLAAFSFWNGKSGVMLDDVLGTLDRGATEALCSLMVAASRGAAAVDAWIARPEVRRVRLPGVHCASPACDGVADIHAAHQGRRPGDPIPVLGVPRPGSFPFCSCSCDDCQKARTAEDADA